MLFVIKHMIEGRQITEACKLLAGVFKHTTPTHREQLVQVWLSAASLLCQQPFQGLARVSFKQEAVCNMVCTLSNSASLLLHYDVLGPAPPACQP